MKNKTLTTLLLVAVFSVITFNSFGQNQMQLNQEANNRYKQAEIELNKTYQKILKMYASDTTFIARLRTSERIWIKFRDAELLVKYPPREAYYYGSIQPMCEANYLEQLTRERIKTLRVWIEGIEEGDVCAGSVRMKQ